MRTVLRFWTSEVPTVLLGEKTCLQIFDFFICKFGTLAFGRKNRNLITIEGLHMDS